MKSGHEISKLKKRHLHCTLLIIGIFIVASILLALLSMFLYEFFQTNGVLFKWIADMGNVYQGLIIILIGVSFYLLGRAYEKLLEIKEEITLRVRELATIEIAMHSKYKE